MINFRELIYHLKRDYGTPLDLYKESNSVLNVETGRATVTRNKYRIGRAVVLPSQIQITSPFLRQANLLFKFSGSFEVDSREILVDAKDLIDPTTGKYIVPEIKDYINYRDQRYDLTEVHQIDKGHKIFGYHIIMKEAKTSTLYAINDIIMNDRLFFAETFNFHTDVEGTLIEDELIFTETFTYDVLRNETISDSIGFNETWVLL